MKNKYSLIDSGGGLKLEQFGEYLIIRPCSLAVWEARLKEEWKNADLIFAREQENRWVYKREIRPFWQVEIEGIIFKVQPTPFGHLGVFPEHQILWKFIKKKVSREVNVLNLFAYSGGATLASALGGAKVCHLDASKPIINWARENAVLNGLENASIRWIVDDVFKFLRREIKRGKKYDGIILDPPTFGRGCKGEVFKIERDIAMLLKMCASLLSKQCLFFIFSTHTPLFSPTVMYNLVDQAIGKKGKIKAEELLLTSKTSYALPHGSYVRWER